eukprot:CAMPEP_0202916102 /NCGR_PEP_ID=MMETSP1392-20130828/67635_1 /ASSEMBLY_ACC=CAM_ASM_000868 /TAXON_ID=225041 /ORGANISM="Chlamydomonas chlamydogama, Strain SAG 11-48b" /LENGTH=138 /DNA_ID=CAMNT_0049608393 /DNA_START=279 /DNA_END=692 /DNA_ORIENTATION=+
MSSGHLHVATLADAIRPCSTKAAHCVALIPFLIESSPPAPQTDGFVMHASSNSMSRHAEMHIASMMPVQCTPETLQSSAPYHGQYEPSLPIILRHAAWVRPSKLSNSPQHEPLEETPPLCPYQTRHSEAVPSMAYAQV